MANTFDKNGAYNKSKKRQCIVCGRWVDEEVFCPNCGAQIPMYSSTPDPTPIRKNDPGLILNPGSVSEPESHSGKTALIVLAVAGGTVLVVSIIVILFFVLKPSKKDSAPEAQPSFLTETENRRTAMSETEEATEETETEETETEAMDADIDAVSNRICTISGLLFYTDQMDDPIVILDAPLSIYVNSTSGEPVYYKTVTQIVFGTCSIRKKKLKRYNNVEVEVTGSLWAENDFVYIDVQDLLGDLPETETETETEADSAYILPESNSRYLTDADVARLSLKEINYAKNEIYARHGRKFDSPELQNYFNSKKWYKGTVDPDDFSTNVFNNYERENIRFLVQKEESIQKGGYKLDQ